MAKGVSASEILNNPRIPESVKKRIRDAQGNGGGKIPVTKPSGEKVIVTIIPKKTKTKQDLQEEKWEQMTRETIAIAKKVAPEFKASVDPIGKGKVHIYKRMDGREVVVLIKHGWSEARVRRECQRYFKESKGKPTNTFIAKLIRGGKTAHKHLKEHSSGQRINPLTGEIEYRAPKGKQKGGMKEKSHDRRESIQGQVNRKFQFKDPLEGRF